MFRNYKYQVNLERKIHKTHSTKNEVTEVDAIFKSSGIFSALNLNKFYVKMAHLQFRNVLLFEYSPLLDYMTHRTKNQYFRHNQSQKNLQGQFFSIFDFRRIQFTLSEKLTSQTQNRNPLSCDRTS